MQKNVTTIHHNQINEYDEVITNFISTDGIIFVDESSCVEYEKHLKVYEALEMINAENLNCSFFNCPVTKIYKLKDYQDFISLQIYTYFNLNCNLEIINLDGCAIPFKSDDYYFCSFNDEEEIYEMIPLSLITLEYGNLIKFLTISGNKISKIVNK